MPSADRRSFDTGASQTVQGDLSGIIGRLEAVIADRDKAVAAAMSDFQADGVSDDYHNVERRWNGAASEVRTIINLLKTTMTQNDQTAGTTLTNAGNAVASIG